MSVGGGRACGSLVFVGRCSLRLYTPDVDSSRAIPVANIHSIIELCGWPSIISRCSLSPRERVREREREREKEIEGECNELREHSHTHASTHTQAHTHTHTHTHARTRWKKQRSVFHSLTKSTANATNLACPPTPNHPHTGPNSLLSQDASLAGPVSDTLPRAPRMPRLLMLATFTAVRA